MNGSVSTLLLQYYAFTLCVHIDILNVTLMYYFFSVRLSIRVKSTFFLARIISPVMNPAPTRELAIQTDAVCHASRNQRVEIATIPCHWCGLRSIFLAVVAASEFYARSLFDHSNLLENHDAPDSSTFHGFGW